MSGSSDSTQEAKFLLMTQQPIPKVIAKMAIPTVISMLITTIYNTADTYFVAQISTTATAAVGVVFSLQSIMQAWGFGLGMGANSLIARRLGAKDLDSANRYASSAFFAAFVFGLVLMLLGIPTIRPLMRLLGSTDTILPYAMAYGRIILIGAPIMCSSYVFNTVLRSEGQAVLGMWGLTTGGILNMFLDPLFIFVFHMGIEGAAWATILSQLVSFSIMGSMFLRKKTIVKISLRNIDHTPTSYLEVLRTGFPTIVRQFLGSFSSALLNIHAAMFGDATVAAVTIANKIYMLVRNVVLGIGQGFQPVAGYNYGAKQYKRVRQAFVFVVYLGTVFCLLSAMLIGFNANTVVAWFRADDPEVIRLGTEALTYCCLVMPLMAYSTFVNQLYQCLGFAKVATLLASCRQGLCFLPLILILPRVLGQSGVGMTQPGADLLTFLVSVPFQIRFIRYLKRLEQKENESNDPLMQ